jgi:hypothetical protein
MLAGGAVGREPEGSDQPRWFETYCVHPAFDGVYAWKEGPVGEIKIILWVSVLPVPFFQVRTLPLVGLFVLFWSVRPSRV